jgi:MGT family glycosyltransferase
MAQEGHFRRLCPLIADVARRGVPAHVFTHRRFRGDVERAGGTFVDLFADHPLEEVDGTSLPVPCRFVSFAGFQAEKIAARLREIGVGAVVYDTFAVVGYVAARLAEVPYVNVCAGHNVDPARFVPLLENESRIELSPSCRHAVELLRSRYGMSDASPFSFITTQSPHLNLYCEPEAYLTEGERRPFEPLAFYGSLPALEDIEARNGDRRTPYFDDGARALKVYASVGTVAWRYHRAAALGVLKSVAEAVAEMPECRAVISLGRAELADDERKSLARPNVSVHDYVDQWAVLGEADVFVTHHGLNSTHEAVFNAVPMISYPISWDQPSLARKCQEFGFAFSLGAGPRAPVTVTEVRRALSEFMGNRESLRRKVLEAAEWEREVIARRDALVRRIIELSAESRRSR